MNIIIFEDDIKYDTWVKFLLVLPLLFLIILGILFSVNARSSNIFPQESDKDSELASIVLFASAVFVLAVYWFVLPRKISVSQDGIGIKFSAFTWNISFQTIASLRAVKGIIFWWGYSCITSYSHQIEIFRKSRFNIRICPRRRDQFLEYANRALLYWTNSHRAST